MPAVHIIEKVCVYGAERGGAGDGRGLGEGVSISISTAIRSNHHPNLVIYFLSSTSCTCSSVSYSRSLGGHKMKALTALVGRLSLTVGWNNGPKQGFATVSFNP